MSTLLSSYFTHPEENSSSQGTTNSIGELQSNCSVSFIHCNQKSVKIHCISLIGLHVYVWRICTFGENTAHNHHEQSHKLRQVYIKGTFYDVYFL